MGSGQRAAHGLFLGRTGAGDSTAAFQKVFCLPELQRWCSVVFADILDNSHVISEDGKKKVGEELPLGSGVAVVRGCPGWCDGSASWAGRGREAGLHGSRGGRREKLKRGI